MSERDVVRLHALEQRVEELQAAMAALAQVLPRLAYQEKLVPGVDVPKLYDRLVLAAIRACEKAAK